MVQKRTVLIACLLVSSLCIVHMAGVRNAMAQDSDTKGSFLLTIFLKHDQSKTLEEINKHLEATGFWKDFPPEGTEVVSWYVMMGIGQVVTLRVPAEKLREVNLLIEKKAWGAFKTDFYPTYDFKKVWEANFKKK
jgi:hypothetical protein